MTNLRKAAQQEPVAYEFLPNGELLYPHELERQPDADYVPLYAALEQSAQQEPYCWMSPEGTIYQASDEDVLKGSIPMYLGATPAQQEPVANIRTWRKNGELHAELWNWDRGIESLPDGEYDLYTRPQAPATPLHGEPLTDEDIDDIWNHYCDEMGYASINDSYEIARAIEAKLKEKNT